MTKTTPIYIRVGPETSKRFAAAAAVREWTVPEFMRHAGHILADQLLGKANPVAEQQRSEREQQRIDREREKARIQREKDEANGIVYEGAPETYSDDDDDDLDGVDVNARLEEQYQAHLRREAKLEAARKPKPPTAEEKARFAAFNEERPWVPQR